ncbi:MAG: AAA family ATPase [Pseudomonadota bacterium]
MAQQDKAYSTVAPITNVALALEALDRSMQRTANLPGLVGFYGPSGYGKSFSATYAANSFRAYYIACKSTSTKKSILKSILLEMGVPAIGNIDDLREQVEEQLVLSQRPLIIDEADYLIDKGLIPLVRDIFDATDAAIMLIGEEKMPAKLKRIERMHGRFLVWEPAQPATLQDAHHLARVYCRDIQVADDLLAEVHRLSQGSVRRISVNLDLIRTAALRDGNADMDLKAWGKRSFFTGEAPARRLA